MQLLSADPRPVLTGLRVCEGPGGDFFAIPDIRCFSAEGLDIAGADVDAILSRAAAEIDKCMG